MTVPEAFLPDLTEMDPVKLISGGQRQLERHAREFLARYEQECMPGRQLPAGATMQVRGLVAIMQAVAENLDIALGNLRRSRSTQAPVMPPNGGILLFLGGTEQPRKSRRVFVGCVRRGDSHAQ
jgi:hypothetical protein